MKVSGLSHFPLGQPVPSRDHAVCVSLPTVEDLIGYEEKKTETLMAMRSGYPRFVRNHRIHELSDHLAQINGKTGLESFFFGNRSDSDFFLQFHEITPCSKGEMDGISHLNFSPESQEANLCKLFQQHSGTGISSRCAEDLLYKKGIIDSREFITASNSSPAAQIKEIIAKAHGSSIDPEDVLLTNSGANAFYTIFKTAHDHANKKGKNIWIRLGWLYLDTIEVMQLLGGGKEQIITINDPQDLPKLESLFKDFGDVIAGVVTEFPTNPLLQSFDLPAVQSLCEEHDSLLVVDPTMASPLNVKVSEFADVVVNSLTKYANWEGDGMMGCLVFPKKSHRGRQLMADAEKFLCPPFHRDLSRLAEQIPFYETFIKQTNSSTLRIARFLEDQPAVKKVYWAYQEKCSEAYENIAGTNKPGCVVSFEIKGDFKKFYNSLRMLKSPSFGTEFSICCPYVYLAHYSMLQSESGRRELKKAGISPEILRLSVGLEPPDEIMKVLAESLEECYSNS